MKRKRNEEPTLKKKETPIELVFPEQISNFYEESKGKDSFLGIDCCAVCAKEQNLIDCPKCQKISYCSKSHLKLDEKVHQQVCPFLCQINEDESLEISREDLKKMILKIKFNSEKLKWKDYFSLDSSVSRKISNFLSYPFTLLYCIGKYNLKELKRIHIIGASKQEIEFLEIWKILFKKFENLTVTFIGPELKKPGNFQVINNGVLEVFNRKYHEYVKNNKDSPDIIVGFHLGLTVPDYNWLESIQKMKHFKKCILLTGFSRDELLMDYNEIEEHINIKMKVEPKLNPFASLKVNQSGTLANDLYKNNMYYSIFDKLE